MPEESFGCPEGVADVSIIVVACFNNSLKEYSIAFLRDVMGAYHVATMSLVFCCLAEKFGLGFEFRF